MSDIAQIKVGEVLYDVKDSISRERLDTFGLELGTKASKNDIAGFKNITISSEEPTSSDGSNGDVWLVYSI